MKTKRVTKGEVKRVHLENKYLRMDTIRQINDRLLKENEELKNDVAHAKNKTIDAALALMDKVEKKHFVSQCSPAWDELREEIKSLKSLTL